MSLEEEYYGGKRPEMAIKNLSSAFREVMKHLVIVRLQSSWQIDNILKRTGKGADQDLYQVDPSDVESVKMFSIKMKMLVPTMFVEMNNELRDILILLKKYCLSFFEGKEKDEFLETASSYKKKRKQFSETIKDTIDHIEHVAMKYTKGVVTLNHLGTTAKELARKSYFFEAPVLYIFADMCQNVRDACKVIIQWVQYDSEYPKFVYYDLEEVQKKRDMYFPKVRDIREKQHQLKHKIQKLQKDIREITEELETLENKRQEKAKLKSEDIKKILKPPRKKKEEKVDKQEAIQKAVSFDSIPGSPRVMGIITSYPIRAFSVSSASSLNDPVPGDDVDDDNNNGEEDWEDDDSTEEVNPNKVKLMAEKKQVLLKKKSTLTELQKIARKQSAKLRDIEYELERLERCFTQLKTIYTLRKSTCITKKLFNNVPMSELKSVAIGNQQTIKPGIGFLLPTMVVLPFSQTEVLLNPQTS